MKTFLHDLSYALRWFRKAPGFTVAAVVTLAVGIGANTAMFSIVESVLLRPLPYPEADRLVRIWAQELGTGAEPSNVNPLDLRDWREAQDVVEVVGVNNRRFSIGGPGEPERVRGTRVTANFFPVFGAETAIGRAFTAGEEVDGGAAVAVISHDLWQRRFQGDPEVVGKSLDLGGVPHTVVGVLRDDFRSPEASPSEQPQLWVPLGITEQTGRGGLWLHAVGRLEPGVALARAATAMDAAAAALARQYPDTNANRGVSLEPLKSSMVGDLERPLVLLFGSVGLVLLIACANVANLLLARAAARRREMTLRAALGAAPGRLIRQLLTESVVLSLLGGVLGLLAAWAVLPALSAWLPADLPRLDEVKVDGTVLLFTLGVAALTGVVFGLLPALAGRRVDLRGVLAEGGRSDAASARRLPLSLVVAEMALALLLLVGAGLLLRSFGSLLAVDVGFDPRRLATVELHLPDDRYPEAQQAVDFYDRLLAEVGAIPGVSAASAADMLPFSGYYSCNTVTVDDGTSPRAEELVPCAEYRTVADGYFDAMGIRLEAGRALGTSDDVNSRPVAVVNRTLARRLWPTGALGRRLTLYFDDSVPHEIVGVVEDVRHFGLDSEVLPEVYVSHRQHPSHWMTLVARGEGEAAVLLPALRDRVRRVDRQLPISSVGTMQDQITASVADPRLRTLLLSAFAGIALFLAAIGLFGVMSYTVNRRTREIGVRMALGAGRRRVMGMVVGQSMGAALAGIAIGVAAALALSRLLQGLLYGISAQDLTVYLVSALALATVALVASYLPARRASRTDPQVALREG